MKKQLLITILLTILAVSTTFVYIAKNKPLSHDKIFDNSKPGLWKITTQLTSSQKKFNGDKTTEVCITQEIIDAAKEKTIQSKFDFEGLKCEESFKKINNENGDFSITCNGINPVKKNKINVELKGNIKTQENYSDLNVEYVVSNTTSQTNFKIKTESFRISDCKDK